MESKTRFAHAEKRNALPHLSVKRCVIGAVMFGTTNHPGNNGL